MQPVTETIGFSFRSLLLTIAVITLSWCALAYPPLPVLRLMADSEQYHAMSTSILDGSLFQQIDTSAIPNLAMVMRPPLFPILLAITALTPLDPLTALVSLHLLLALAILTLTPFLLRQLLPPPLTAIACGLSLYSAKQVLWGDMSEWLAMSCIFSSVLAFLLWSHNRSPLSAFFTTLFVALAILTRSALIPWLIIPTLLLARSAHGVRRAVLLPIALGLVPLMIWSAIQTHRFGSFSIGAYEGLNLLATARSLGTIPIAENDSTETKLVLERLNARGVTATKAGMSPAAVHAWDGEFYAAFHNNFDELCAAFQSLAPHGHLSAPRLAARGFLAHAGGYGAFLLGGSSTFISDYAALPLLCLTVAAWIVILVPHERPLATVTITVSMMTIVYLVTIFGSILWLHRYVVPVQPVLIFLASLSLFALARGVHRTIR